MSTFAQINRKRHDRSAIVTVVGELDLSNAHQLIIALARTITPDQPTVLDLSGVTFMDATGTHVLTDTSRIATGQHARLIIVPSPAVSRVLDLLPRDPALNLRRDLASAMSAAEHSPS